MNRYRSGGIEALLVVVAAVALLSTSACGSEERQKPSKPFNHADVEFVLAAGGHLTTVVTTAQTANRRSGNHRVQKLTRRILDVQGPHADAIARWVLAWGEQGASVGHDDVADGAASEPGGFDARTRTRMSKIQGNRFDKVYLTALIEHLESGRAIWQTEADSGNHDGAIKLATVVLDEHAQLRVAAQNILRN